MNTHEVEAEDFKHHETEHEIAFNIGRGNNKRLLTVVQIASPPVALFRVRNHGELVIETKDFSKAVKAYNDIQPNNGPR